MKYTDALKLHNGDEVTVKENGATMIVLWTEHYLGQKLVIVHLEDGFSYDHREIR